MAPETSCVLMRRIVEEFMHVQAGVLCMHVLGSLNQPRP